MTPVQAVKSGEVSTAVYGSSTGVVAFPRGLLITAMASFFLKCAMALATFGSLDVYSFNRFVPISYQPGGVASLFRNGIHLVVRGHDFGIQYFSHPPSMIHVLRLWYWMGGQTGLPLQFWMRFYCAIADLVSLIFLWELSRRMPALRIKPVMLVIVAASPISLMVSGFHGNTDPIMVCFLLASVYYVESKAPIMAGVLFGLAMCIKIVPIIFALAVLMYLPTVASRLRFALSAGFVFVGAGLPFFATDTAAILHGFAFYNSGMSAAAVILGALGISLSAHKLVWLIVLIPLSIWMNVKRDRVPLFVQFGVITSYFLALSPGFGLQHLVWAVPWIACLGLTATLAYSVIPGAFLCLAYTVGSGGFPWYAADHAEAGLGPLGTPLILACWLTNLFIFCIFLRRAGRDNPYR
jgi:hypothetical protein